MQTPPLSTNPETSLTPPASCCSPKSKLLCLSVGLVVLAIVATASFLLGKYSSQNKTPTPTAIVTPRPTLFPTPTSNPTAGWETYSNSSLGFELKYPPSVKIDKEFNDQYNRGTFFKGGNLNFGVMLRSNSGITLDKYYYMDSPIKRKTTLSGMTANVYELPNGYCDGPSCSEPSITIVSEKGSDLYHISFHGDIKLSETENQILSTFKFLDQASTNPTTNWKTYSDNKYKLQFKYPEDWPIESHDVTDFPSNRIITVGPISNLIVSADIVKSDNCLNKKRLYESQGYTSRNVVVGELTAWRVSLPGGQNPPQEVVCLEKGNLIFEISFSLGQNKEKDLETFGQILSTFKF